MFVFQAGNYSAHFTVNMLQESKPIWLKIILKLQRSNIHKEDYNTTF